MSFLDKLTGVVKALGPTALSFVPGVGPVLTGVAKLAQVIGGDNGSKIDEGLKMVTEGLAAVGKQPLSPDQHVELETSKMDMEVQLKEIAYKEKKLNYDDQAGGREVIKMALLSSDELVRQARPKMMLMLGKSAIAYTFLTPVLVVVLAKANVDKEMLGLVVKLVLWQGGTLWTTFTASFTGYTVARSVDKKSAAMAEVGMAPSELMKTLSALGKKIS